MELSRDNDGHYLHVNSVQDRHITVAGRKLENSFLLTPRRMVEDWPVADVRVLDASSIGGIIALQPELVVLGTGMCQIFPDAAFMAALLRRGIGIEVMDNAAAARTYDLLANEGRRVMAAFILQENS